MEEKPTKEDEVFVEEKPHKQGRKIATGLLLLGLCLAFAYAFREYSSAKQIATSRDELTTALNQERSQVETLTQKLSTAQSELASVSNPPLNSQTSGRGPISSSEAARRYSARRTTNAKAHRTEDPWRKQFQSQLSEQQKLIAEHQREIEETKESVEKNRADLEGNLQSTRDDLNGSIAKNHEELVALERKGERNFYEFDLPKSKQFQKEGPIGISLRKSNSKHEYCDLVMIVNDSEVSKKHVNLYEPVLFYPEGFSQPLQVVINSIGKNGVRGYVSEPKYKPSELVASGPSSGGTAAAAAGQTAPGSSTKAGALKHRPEAQQ
jgi:flagellar biosynthesis chaperone FliJ